MNVTKFVFGSELQGRGYATSRDLTVGFITTAVAMTALTGAIINIYLIKKLKVFHNAFGCFWGVRTIGELGNDTVFAFYTGPITILQPTNIPPEFGIFAYHFSFFFVCVQCAMNLVIALNRFVAVCYPVRYKFVFNKKVCLLAVGVVVVGSIFVVLLYFIFPCNHLGYSPRFYANVFIKCRGDLDRDYSQISKFVYRICFSTACMGTAVINSITFSKIVFIRLSSITTYNNKEFRRDVRLFTLAVVQDILMTIVGLVLIITNNAKGLSVVGVLFSYDGLIFIYAFNTASMMFCNPECRRYLSSKLATSKPTVSTTLTSGQLATSR
uniref:7TM_GPCR_Srx domain-containing protein n=1 Tax=Steinernema glaseri TaxID=37863 RepID=A0A1I7YJQ7_9BILA